MNTFNIISQDSGSSEYTIHSYTTCMDEARRYLERISFEDLKHKMGKNINDRMDCPLKDTVPINQISGGMTIRYDEKDDHVINLIKIEKLYTFGVIPNKTISVIKTFKIKEVEPICNFYSVGGEEDDVGEEE